MKKLLLLFVSLFLCLPAKADLVFKGNHFTHRRDFKKVYAEMPERGKEIDVDVFELPNDEWTIVDDFFESEGVLAVYFPTKRIYITTYKYEGKDYSSFIFAHEYGHHVYFNSLSKEEREDWANWWILNLDKMPRKYATANAAEGFAECFAMTYHKGRIPWDMKLDDAARNKIISYFLTKESINVSGISNR